MDLPEEPNLTADEIAALRREATDLLGKIRSGQELNCTVAELPRLRFKAPS